MALPALAGAALFSNPITAAVAVAGLAAGGAYLKHRSAVSASRAQAAAAQQAANATIDNAGLARDALTGGYDQASAALAAAHQKALAEYDAYEKMVRENYAPYITQGSNALQQQAALSGLLGSDAQKTAVEAVSTGQEYLTLVREQETAILQNASATGGLRGGDTQKALATTRATTLQDLIDKQFNRLGTQADRGLTATNSQVGAQGNIAGSRAQLQQGFGNSQAQLAAQRAQAAADFYTTRGNALAQQYGTTGQAVASQKLASGQATGEFLGGLAQQLGQGAALQGYAPYQGAQPLTFAQGFLGLGGGLNNNSLANAKNN